MPRFNPWRELRRRPHLRFARTTLPPEVGGALLIPHGDLAAVLMDRNLNVEERNVALTHELVHDERGGGIGWPGNPPGWDAVVIRDELAVDREVARRLIPADELEDFLAGPASMDEPVEPWQVAEAFGVTDRCARLAMEQRVT